MLLSQSPNLLPDLNDFVEELESVDFSQNPSSQIVFLFDLNKEPPDISIEADMENDLNVEVDSGDNTSIEDVENLSNASKKIHLIILIFICSAHLFGLKLFDCYPCFCVFCFI